MSTDARRDTSPESQESLRKAIEEEFNVRLDDFREGAPKVPRKLTWDVRLRIINALKEGAFFDTAAYKAGVTPTCVRRWMEIGEKGGGEPYVSFFCDVRQAQAEYELKQLRAINQAIEDAKERYPGAELALRVLAHRWPRRWSPNRIAFKNGAGAPLEPERPVEEVIDEIRRVIQEAEGEHGERDSEQRAGDDKGVAG